MKALIQRVLEASVEIEGSTVASIGKGFLVLLGVTHSDTEKEADQIAERISKLRIFEDENGKTNRSVVDVGGSVIVVSQFTLYADFWCTGFRTGRHCDRSWRIDPDYQDQSRSSPGNDREKQ